MRKMQWRKVVHRRMLLLIIYIYMYFFFKRWFRDVINAIMHFYFSLLCFQNQLSGNLLRKFKNSNGWQKLWVVFTNFSLFFYKSHQVSGAGRTWACLLVEAWPLRVLSLPTGWLSPGQPPSARLLCHRSVRVGEHPQRLRLQTPLQIARVLLQIRERVHLWEVGGWKSDLGSRNLCKEIKPSKCLNYV